MGTPHFFEDSFASEYQLSFSLKMSQILLMCLGGDAVQAPNNIGMKMGSLAVFMKNM